MPIKLKILLFLWLFLFHSMTHAAPRLIEMKKIKRNLNNDYLDLIFADRGIFSPFILVIHESDGVGECKSANKRVIIFRVSDYGEVPDHAAYCLTGVSNIQNLSVSRIVDEKSQVGFSALVTFRHGESGNHIKIKISPWAAELSATNVIVR